MDKPLSAGLLVIRAVFGSNLWATTLRTITFPNATYVPESWPNHSSHGLIVVLCHVEVL